MRPLIDEVPLRDRQLLSLLGAEERGASVQQFEDNDWECLLKRAAEFGVSAFLYERLYTNTAVPRQVRDDLRSSYLTRVAASTALFHELGQVLSLLRSSGVEVVALKGAHLAEAVYENSVLRPMADVDLLVRREHLRQAWEALLAAGFVPERHVPNDIENLAHHHLAPLSGNGIVIELHSRLTAWGIGTNDTAGAWERARPAKIAGVEVLVLSPEDLLVHLSLHAAAHHGCAMGFLPLLDLIAVMRRHGSELNPEDLAARAAAWGATKSLALLLTLAGELLGASPPRTMLECLAPGGVSRDLCALAIRQMFQTGTDHLETPITVSRLLAAGGPAEFFSILRKRLAVTPDKLLWSYGVGSKAMIPLLYLIHPFVLLARQGGWFLRVLLRDTSAKEAHESALRHHNLVKELGTNH